MRRGYVDTRDGQVFFREEGSGRPLLFVMAGNADAWIDLLPLFAARGFRAISFDPLGTGLSDPCPPGSGLSYWAQNVAEAAGLVGLTQHDVICSHTLPVRT